MRAPSRASASAAARPCPCAAPVMKATLPWKSLGMSHAFGFGVAIFVKILVELHFERIIDNVRSDHQCGKGGERDDLLCVKKSSYLLVKFVRHAIAMLGDGAAEFDERLALFVELQFVRILAPFDQDAPHEGGADQAIAFGGNGVRKNG